MTRQDLTAPGGAWEGGATKSKINCRTGSLEFGFWEGARNVHSVLIVAMAWIETNKKPDVAMLPLRLPLFPGESWDASANAFPA